MIFHLERHDFPAHPTRDFRKILAINDIWKQLIFGVFTTRRVADGKYAKYEEVICQEKSYAYTNIIIVSLTDWRDKF